MTRIGAGRIRALDVSQVCSAEPQQLDTCGASHHCPVSQRFNVQFDF